jgi:hypothetical protein
MSAPIHARCGHDDGPVNGCHDCEVGEYVFKLEEQRLALLEALQAFEQNNHWNHHTIGPLKAAARAAIAKATS